MSDENNIEWTDEQLLQQSLHYLSEACCFLYEIETAEGRAAAFMADAALRYAQTILHGKDPRISEEVELSMEMDK